MPRPTVHRTPFGSAHGTETHLWTLDSGAGVRAEILTYGATLHRLTVPDTSGTAGGVVRSLTGIDDYTAKHPYFGAVVGRYANRIAHGRFTLDGTEHHVPANDRGHALHGGPDGFHTKVWEATGDHTDDTASVRLTLHSPHGDMGFPGALDTTVTYTLDTAGTLAVDYESVTDRATVVSLTNHAYFDLAGYGDVLGHRLQVDADAYLPVDGDGIPLGAPAGVQGTPFDLTEPRVLGERLGREDGQLRAAGGFDHCWVLREPTGADGLRRAARLTAPDESRVLEVWTTQPGIQVYTANQLDGAFTDGTGRRHERHGSLCLETQHLPDAPNRPDFPSTVLRPGETARSRTELRFPHLPGRG
ncbi:MULTISPECIES: aldose epimerase family protein [unclassified Streptomyces]|uniref:aldose epimerase family protein n=1 Tax=unclassified Streptomyces TaxID=2593676 RepID=UPI0001C1A7DC|nr:MULTISPECIES: aldose epimerase family protein [unclassified Streptomyces]AEN08315.1 Aldose 1-epimerase [Streptomyces sp. SirexAA-E]MYR68458.1 galactose-1-epimerase [Streptomyces sp. SID4939]MYS00378.1 galactose-1-epimerase [Streptomyces sp. SID4940]MYT66540.1 galactose-1-epimerase [Streptomyces sp. SID8357]MYT83461.1 galactose-1-epimerase [Streptomyces sp. SID8360]